MKGLDTSEHDHGPPGESTLVHILEDAGHKMSEAMEFELCPEAYSFISSRGRSMT